MSNFLGCSIPWTWPRFNGFWPDYGRNNRRVKGMFREQLFPWKISLFSILLNFLIKFLSHTFNSWCTQNRESNSTYLYVNLLQIIVVFLNPKGTREDGRSHAQLRLLEPGTLCAKPGCKELQKVSLAHSATQNQLTMGSAMLLLTDYSP